MASFYHLDIEAPLRSYFVTSPETFDYTFKDIAQRDLRRELFKAASANGKYIKAFFPDLEDEDSVNRPLQQEGDEGMSMDVDSDTDVGSSKSDRVDQWTINNSNKVDPSHPGRPCVRKFKRGEPTYRCLTCGLDDTCVMCQYCYDEETHRGHQVTVSISQQDCGGVCDCGDPEAWVKQFPCKYHMLDQYGNEPLPEELRYAIRATTQIALDFAIDVFSQAHTAVQRFRDPTELIANEARSELSEEMYGMSDDQSSHKYVLTLWNDQKHSIVDGVNLIRQSTKKKRSFAAMVTKRISDVGRATVAISSDLDMLFKLKKLLSSTDLTSTIRSQRDTFREEMAGAIVDWLVDVLKAPVCGNYLATREIIVDVLLGTWQPGLRSLLETDFRYPMSQEYANAKAIDYRSGLDGPYIPDQMKYVEEMTSTNMDLDDDVEASYDEEYAQDGDEEEEQDDAVRDNNQRDATHVHAAHDEGRAAEVIDAADGVPALGNNNAVEAEDIGQAMELVSNVNGFNQIAELLGYPVRPPQARPRAKRPKLTNHQPDYWLNQSSVSKGKKQRLSARIQYLIFFDVRLWKNLRQVLRDVYVSVFATTPESKLALGRMYAEIYIQVVQNYILSDREPECSIISSLSTQLYTTPTIATDLVKYDLISQILAGIYTYITTQHIMPPATIDIEASLLEETRGLRNRRFAQLFHDIEYIINRNTEKQVVTGDPDRIAQLVDVLMLLQGQSPMQRMKSKHIEYESEGWISVFNFVPYVHQLGMHFAQGATNVETATMCLRVLVPKLAQWVMNQLGKRNNKTEATERPKFRTVMCSWISNMNLVSEMETVRGSILDFEVASGMISLHHPVHTFMTWVIENAKFSSAKELRDVLLPEDEITGPYTHEQLLSALFDHPLRVLVLMSQIQAGLWVRNGMYMRSQLMHYRDLTLRELSYRRDIFAVQVMLCVMDPALAFMTIYDRWDIRIDHVNENEDDGYDDTKRLYMIEEFLHFLIGILMERDRLMGDDEQQTKRRYVKKEIIQCLGFGEMTFSEICKIVPDTLSNEACFEEVLKEMAVFKPPRGVNDYGKYHLRPEHMEHFDTHYINFTWTRIEEAQNTYAEHYRKLSNDPEKVVVTEPPLEKIPGGAFKDLSAFTRTVPFMVMLRDILSVVLEDDNDSHRDSILSNLLQLLHIAVLDDLNCSSMGSSFSSLLAREFFQSEKSEMYSVLTMLCHIVNEDIFGKGATAKILRIIALIRQREPSLDEYVKLNLSQGKVDAIPEVESEGDRRKRIGKEKRLLAMANMKTMQQKFVENNELSDDEDDGAGEGDGFNYWNEECILCRMTDNSTIFGAIGYSMCSNVWRDVPWADKDWVYEAFGGSQDLDQACSSDDVDNSGDEHWQQYRYQLREDSKIGHGFPPEDNSRKPVFVTCGHGVHLNCYKDYIQNNNSRGNILVRNFPEDPSQGEFLCPLCNSICNVFLPCMWKQNQRKLDDVLAETMTFEKYVDRLQSLEEGEFFDSNNLFGNLDGGLIKQGVQHLTPQFSSLLAALDPSQNIPGSAKQLQDKFAEDLDDSLWQAISQMRRTVMAGTGFHDDTSPFSTVIDSFTNTLSSLEIALRGQSHEGDMFGAGSGIVVGQIKGRTLEGIRLFGEFCKTTAAILALLDKNREHMLGGAQLQRRVYLDLDETISPLKLSNVNFDNFVQNAILTAPGGGVDLAHLLKTYAMGTICTTILRIVREVSLNENDWLRNETLPHMPLADGYTDEAIGALGELVSQIRNNVEVYSSGSWSYWNHKDFGKVVYSMIVKTLTPFLRKCAIFVHTICDVGYRASDWEEDEDEDMENPTHEVDKLCRFLRLPQFNTLLQTMVYSLPEQRLVNRWFEQMPDIMADIEYPGIVRLLRLPQRLEEFFSVENLVVDSKSKDPKLPADPAVCLFCGTAVGLQMNNFKRDPRGACNSHMEKCGLDVGIYLLPKRSSILLLRGGQGSFIESPYLDLHGEADETLRRGRPQFLQVNRYEHFTRNVWLMHGLPTIIARKLESTTDFGGWETM